MPSLAAMPTHPNADSGAQVRDLIAHRVLRALAERVRYRYVQPRVWRDGDGFRVESPCCSRNVEPDGGVIDIALLLPPGVIAPSAEAADPVPPDSLPNATQWRLYARDHAQGTWRFHEQATQMDALLDMLCLDAQRVFWP